MFHIQKKQKALVLSLFAAMAISLIPSGALQVNASSHREAPAIANDPVRDSNDFYMFRSPTNPNNLVLIATVATPLQQPWGAPNYFQFGTDDTRYEIKLDNNGDAVEDVTYRFEFTTQPYANPNSFLYNNAPITSLSSVWNLKQTYKMTEIKNGVETIRVNGAVVPPNDIAEGTIRNGLDPNPNNNGGLASTQNFTSALADAAIQNVNTNSGIMKVYAGPSDDPFWVDLGSVFNLLQIRQLPGFAGSQNDGIDSVKFANSSALAIEVPMAEITKDGLTPNANSNNNIIGAWNVNYAKRLVVSTNGNNNALAKVQWKQVSRLGHPLVNEVVIPISIKDAFNGLEPKDDLATFNALFPSGVNPVTDPEVGLLLNALYGINVPPQPGRNYNGTVQSNVNVNGTIYCQNLNNNSPRNDLVTIFLTGIPGVNKPQNVQPAEMLRLNLLTPVDPACNFASGNFNSNENPRFSDYCRAGLLGSLGTTGEGFPNGRRLMDDVVDIEIQAVAGATYNVLQGGGVASCITPDPLAGQLGDSVAFNDRPFRSQFPYLARAWDGYHFKTAFITNMNTIITSVFKSMAKVTDPIQGLFS